MVNILRVRAKIPAMLERCGYKVVIALSANMYPMYPCYSLPVLPPPRHCPMSFLQRITLHTMQRAWDASFQCQCYSLPYWSRAPVSLWNGIYYLLDQKRVLPSFAWRDVTMSACLAAFWYRLVHPTYPPCHPTVWTTVLKQRVYAFARSNLELLRQLSSVCRQVIMGVERMTSFGWSTLAVIVHYNTHGIYTYVYIYIYLIYI